MIADASTEAHSGYGGKTVSAAADGWEEAGDKRSGFPLSLVFIVGTEFCERFAYKGMSTVLALYLMVRA